MDEKSDTRENWRMQAFQQDESVQVTPEEVIRVYFSFDLEATGLKTKEDEITEIGVCTVVEQRDNRWIVLPETFCQRVRIKGDLCIAAQRITKITKEQLMKEQPFVDVLAKFTDYIARMCFNLPRDAERCFLGYNIKDFDGPLLLNEMHKNGLDVIKYTRQWRISHFVDMLPFCRNPKIIDATKLPRDKTGRAIYRLGEIYSVILGKPLVGAHGALQDSIGVLQLLLHIADLREIIVCDIKSKNPTIIVNFMQFVTKHTSEIKKITTSKKDDSVKKERTIDMFYFKKAKIDQESSNKPPSSISTTIPDVPSFPDIPTSSSSKSPEDAISI